VSDVRIRDVTIAHGVIDAAPRVGATPAGRFGMHKDLEVVSTT
jgi:hypothetical protein